MGMADIEAILGTPDEDITDASLTEYLGYYVIYVEFVYPDLNQTERYWISLVHGLPLKAESLVDGELVYTATTQELSIPS